MDEKADNPYLSPGSSQHSGKGQMPNGQPPPVGGLLAILALCIAFGLIAAMSLMAFVVQFGLELPNGDRFVSTDPLWVFSHLVRGTALSFLTFYLWRYASAVGKQPSLHKLLSLQIVLR